MGPGRGQGVVETGLNPDEVRGLEFKVNTENAPLRMRLGLSGLRKTGMSGIMRMYWAFANEFCCFRLGVTVQGLGRRFRWDSNGFCCAKWSGL